MEYLYSLDTSCYVLGASGENDCYDCTGIMRSYFKDTVVDGYRPKYKLNTWEIRGDAEYGDLEKVSIDDAITGDFVLHIPIEGKSEGTHTATFVRKVDDNHIEILDTFNNKSSLSTRIVPYKGNIHMIVLVKNPYF